MKSITIHGLDQPLCSMLKAAAESDGTSLNKTIKRLLEKALGIIPNDNNDKKGEFLEFSGVWSKDDLEEFNKCTEDFERIDPEEWR